jgi:signal transduction histidine kinase
VDLYEPLAADLGLSIKLSGDVAPVVGHKALLSQAVSNLLDNAIRYAPAGSAIDLSLDEAASVVRLAVRDRGPGIPPDACDRVLKPFVTLDPSRTGGSSGLGLALVASVAALHGGTVEVRNAVPGLRVCLSIPSGTPHVAMGAEQA